MQVVTLVLDGAWRVLVEAFSMFWETLWALVLGFALSGAVQAFVSRERMRRVAGDHRPRTLARAGVLGAVSSSCSYAAAALARSLFARGADFTAAVVFMVASTNLVVELGLVLWLMLGWRYALAELVGGVLMILLLGLVLPRVVPESLARRVRPDPARDGPGEQRSPDGAPPARPWRTRAGWSDAAAYTISDLGMLRRELVIGFVVAGAVTVLVPVGVWPSLFWTGPGLAPAVENAVLGPLLALLAFVCSVGNVPLAAALAAGGAGFGGVVAFVFGDLITLPLLMIYRKYYGTRITLRLLAVLWATMSLAGLAVQYLFAGLGLLPAARPTLPAMRGIGWDHTTWLNLVALVVLAVLLHLHRTRARHGGGRGYARDPVCGMQVATAEAPATAVREGVRSFFCSEGCRDTFLARR